MAVVDLYTRITNSWEKYNSNIKSSDSFIFIEPQSYIDRDGPASLDLTIGDRCFFQKDNKYFTIPDEGLIVQSFEAVLVETEQKLSLPLNIFGMVTGKGNQIFQGAFISSGKINPGYSGNLKIGIYNGGREKIKLKKGEPLCSCVFFQMESSLPNPPNNTEKVIEKSTVRLTLGQKFQLWFKRNKNSITVIISILALIIALLSIILNKNFIGYNL